MKKIIFMLLICKLIFPMERLKIMSVEDIKKPKNKVFER
jgi:hypothetical protein